MENMSELIETAEQFLAAAKSYKGDMHEQKVLLGQLDKMRFLLEDPMDVMIRQWDNIHLIAALNVLVSSGTLQKIPPLGTAKCQELADAVGIDESVIARSMRLLVVQGIATEPEPKVYAHNEKSLAYITSPAQYFFECIIDQDFVFSKLPSYFATHSLADFIDLKKSPYAYAHNHEGLNYYETLSAEPRLLRMFNNTMVQIETTIPVLGMFPFASLKDQVEAEPDRPFIVDIGGGKGQALKQVQQEVPNGFGAKMILQDRPDVLESVPDKEIPGIEKMEHDFFTEQPVKNAHIYLLRRILHDFPPHNCQDILRQIIPAMSSSSRILIADFIIPTLTEPYSDRFRYYMDFSMMMLSGRERTVEEFQEMLGGVGLEILKVWKGERGQGVLEVVLKRE